MSETKPPKAGGLLGRLFGVREDEESDGEAPREEPKPAHADPVPVAASSAEAAPAPEPPKAPVDEIPMEKSMPAGGVPTVADLIIPPIETLQHPESAAAAVEAAAASAGTAASKARRRNGITSRA